MVKRRARARGRRLSLQLVWFGSAYRSVLGCAHRGLGGEVERRQGGDDQRGHRPEAGRERLVAAGVADAATDLFAAEFL